MSFGYTTNCTQDYDQLRKAIEYADKQNVLLFAAAANSGGQSEQSWPAREPEVICVHSTNTFGDRSPFSPTALPERPNFATVGDTVESLWPRDLCTRDTQQRGIYRSTRSGTSYATAILASISAFLLMYARLIYTHDSEKLKTRKRMMNMLQECASKGPDHRATLRDGFYFVDLRRLDYTLFGRRSDDEIRRLGVFRRILNVDSS